MNITNDILYKVDVPARYTGGELNMCAKDLKDIDIRFCFCFPDVYEVGMSHIGSRILYHVLNEREDTYCERCFAPYDDMEKLMIENGIPLFSLESKDDLKKFDFLGFTLQYEMSYTNILNMLNLSNIKVRSSDREEDDPIIIMGGPCAYNPEPLYKIADLFVIGEGEEIINEILDLYKSFKGKKEDFLYILSTKVKGVYVPSFYDVEYNDDGTIKKFYSLKPEVSEKIEKRFLKTLAHAPFSDKPIVPYTDIVHNRVVVEVFRGCTQGCRFCQAGMIYRPVREKSKEEIMEKAGEIIKNTGYDEVSLSSLSTCDYSELNALVRELMEEYEDEKVSISIPSIRVASFSIDLLSEVQKVRKTGLTFAPEAGSQRIRDMINKGVNEEEILEVTRKAFSKGWGTIKLYFMLGLPYETIEDAEAIGDLCNAIRDEYYKVPFEKRAKNLRINASISIFVPKSFTPFQWSRQSMQTDILEKVNIIRKKLSKNINLNYHQTQLSFLEAVFARGDRRLCDVLIKAYENGAKFDGWTDYFNYDAWVKAFEEMNVDAQFYAYREKEYDENLPWDFINIGVSKSYLKKENEKAKNAMLTLDCRGNCTGCGINTELEGKCFDGSIYFKTN